jgi:hypothetical protein
VVSREALLPDAPPHSRRQPRVPRIWHHGSQQSYEYRAAAHESDHGDEEKREEPYQLVLLHEFDVGYFAIHDKRFFSGADSPT